MDTLEQIKNLKKQGIENQEIIRKLQEQGISPKQISDALDQSQVKKKVLEIKDGFEEDMQPSIMSPKEGQMPEVPRPKKTITPGTSQTSRMPAPTQMPEKRLDTNIQRPSQITQEIKKSQIEEPQEDVFYPPQPEQKFSPQETYDYQSGNYEEGINTDTIIEISEQIFNEKILTISKQIDNLEKFKSEFQIKIDHLSTRLEKIESIINKLQVAILEKIGSYGQNLNSIKKEMSMMQDSFGKIINPLADKSSQNTNNEYSKKRLQIPPTQKITNSIENSSKKPISKKRILKK